MNGPRKISVATLASVLAFAAFVWTPLLVLLVGAAR